MISDARFTYWMTLIADRTNRTLLPPTYTEYKQALDVLSPEEFEFAAREVFRDSTFWPSPKEFLDRVTPDIALEAAEAFERVQNAAQYSAGIAGAYWRPEDVIAVSPEAARAFAAIGGRERMNGITPSNLHYAIRDFVQFYIAAKRGEDLHALADVTFSRQLPAGRANHEPEPVGNVVQRMRP